MNKIKKNFFVTATDTNVGKTIISAALKYKFNALYWKPIQCGKNSEGLTDSEKIKKILNLKDNEIIKEVYCLKEPLSPNIASEKENIKINLSSFSFKKKYSSKNLIVEGAGGLLVPINKKYFVVDLIRKIGFPIVLVSSTKLGTINHTLMSLEIIKKNKLKIMGIVFIGKKNIKSIETIKFFAEKIFKKKIKILGEIPLFKNIDKSKILKISKLIKL